MGDRLDNAKSGEERRAERKKQQKDISRLADEVKNPCLKESQMSLKCMSDNDYDRDKCSLYFQNYKNCQDFWSRVSLDRKRKGVKPYLPLPEERPSIKAQYLNQAS